MKRDDAAKIIDELRQNPKLVRRALRELAEVAKRIDQAGGL